jgi:threonine synthase
MNTPSSKAIPQSGNTPLLKVNILEKRVGINSIYIKLEQNNPTHTHKDRAASMIVKKAKEKKFQGVTIGTCGNYGVSVAYFCSLCGLKSRLFIPRSYDIPRLKEMQSYGADIEFVEGTYEDAVVASAKYAKLYEYFDANPHGVGAEIAIEGYKKIAHEIVKDLGNIPLVVWVPVGNGTLLTGIYLGLLEKSVKFTLGAVSSKGNNEITESYIQKRRIGLKGSDLKETHINEPLLNWLPTQLEESLHALKDSNGYAYGATDTELVSASDIIKSSEGITTTPSSAAGLAGLLKFKEKLPDFMTHVIVLTN